MKQQNKLSQEPQEQVSAEQKTQQQFAREFAGTDELLRDDARNIEVPARIATRLQQSIDQLPQTQASWWRRLFKH